MVKVAKHVSGSKDPRVKWGYEPIPSSFADAHRRIARSDKVDIDMTNSS